MIEAEISRRVLLRNAVYVGGGILVLGACTSGDSDGSGGGSSELPEVEGGELITDPAQFPTSFQESPDSAKLVAAGQLPAVAERIGQDPLVLKPVHGIGTYGGTLRRGFLGVQDIHTANLFCAGPDNLLYWDYLHENVIPNMARGFEMSDDHTKLILYLRRGIHWSDGHPFTADDIVFWRDDINLHETISRPSTALRIGNRDVVVERVDDYTVRYRSPVPYAMLPEFLASLTDIGGQAMFGAAGGGGFAPKHYLSQFHPTYTSEEAANRLATEAGFDSWPAFLLNRNSWYLNPDLPTLTPWIVTRPINDPPWEFAANPYSIWVDTEGNQLPYIGSISMSDTSNTDVMALRAVSGEYDFMDRGLQIASLPVLIKNEERSDYTIHRAPGEAIDCAVLFNLAYDTDPEIGELIRTVEFRRALSLGVDRHQINETFFLGTSRPSATVAADSSDYFLGAEWRTKWASHDVQQANDLLDGLGLTGRDGDGFRMLRSGRDRIRLDCQSADVKVDYPAIGETIRRQWRQIGIDIANQTVDGALLGERTLANELMLSLNTIQVDDPFLSPAKLLPVRNKDMIGIPYAQWFSSGGREGTEPPESVRLLSEALRLYQCGLQTPEAETIQLGQQIFKLHADQVWTIGVVGFGPAVYGLYYAKNNLGNVPASILNSSSLLKTPTNTLPMTFYYEG